MIQQAAAASAACQWAIAGREPGQRQAETERECHDAQGAGMALRDNEAEFAGQKGAVRMADVEQARMGDAYRT